jgi:hypothetical protein
MLRCFNMTYVEASKSGGPLPEFTFWKDATFLKRSFRLLGRSWIGQLPLEEALSTSLWYRAKPKLDDRKSQCDNANDTLAELFFHGRTVFDKYRKVFIRTAKLSFPNFHYTFWTYDELKRQYWESL